jgi:hypothetical protein
MESTTVSFTLRAQGCALMAVIDETNDAVGHSRLIRSAHHYAKTITKPITIHHGNDWHILTVEPSGAVTCECCGNPLGSCICDPDA